LKILLIVGIITFIVYVVMTADTSITYQNFNENCASSTLVK